MADLSETEVVACGDPRAEMLAILRNAYNRVKAGEIVGIMLIAELPGGAYRATVSSSSNVAERIGRLELLKLDVAALAREDD